MFQNCKKAYLCTSSKNNLINIQTFIFARHTGCGSHWYYAFSASFAAQMCSSFCLTSKQNMSWASSECVTASLCSRMLGIQYKATQYSGTLHHCTGNRKKEMALHCTFLLAESTLGPAHLFPHNPPVSTFRASDTRFNLFFAFVQTQSSQYSGFKVDRN